jgi:DNA-binding NtrC family response regulator
MNRKDKRILIVDDDPNQLESLKDALEESGFCVITAVSPKASLDLFKKHQFSIVLSDLTMPEMDGLALLDHAKKHNPNTKRFLMTALRTFKIPNDYAQTVSKIFYKPFSIEELISVF